METKEELENMNLFELDTTKKKKKKKTKKKKDKVEGEDQGVTEGTTESVQEDKTENPFDVGEKYEYSDLLKRIQDKMMANNPEMGSGVKFSIPMPNVGPLGSRKTMWANFNEIITSINRKSDHVKSFVEADLGVESNLNEKKQLVIKGRFSSQQVKQILKNYLKEYVKCNNCKSHNTDLEKDAAIRSYILKCKACGATNTVQKVKKGFHNLRRGERRKR
ncbi:unnamed protein product [Moneuplotes crassus]|uniref:Translation initiation factor IF2/IF5 domain-containing protein n=2 Tax=Euplotes crassus TaxID=5936 RepID=A0A7S3KAQ5_EUPCR|nr:unnamed protein product [Moneuplotes crassus]|mmetsp:Transcript_18238/g.17927  ORF Transcript_18238/g.17927 Transcript_18238/m.17927 type:complete len:219 (+) Transcript_18238:14-670(+)